MSSPTGVTPPKANISGYKTSQVPKFTPEMMKIFGSLLSGVQGGIPGGLDYLSKLASGDEEAFAEAEAPAYSAFQKTLGDIGTRFAGVGAMGSSGFQNATSGAARELSENLGAQRMGIRQNAIDSLMQLADRLLSKEPYQTFATPKTDWWEMAGNILASASGGFGGGVGGAAGKKFFGG